MARRPTGWWQGSGRLGWRRSRCKAELIALLVVHTFVWSVSFPFQLPGPAQKLVEVLAEVAEVLEVDHPDELTLSVRLSEVLEKSSRVPEEDLRRTEEDRESQRRRLEMVELKDKVQRQLRAAEKEAPRRKEQMSQTAKKASFMKEKQKDYVRVSSKHEQALNRAGMRSELRHERLAEKASELIKFEEERLKPLTAKLESYRSLPPDLTLAKLKVAEAEEELEELTKRLNSEINMLHI